VYASVWVPMTCIVLLVSHGLLGARRTLQSGAPFRIGALTESWGPTPSIVALRDGLLELGYSRERAVCPRVRFNPRDLAALPPRRTNWSSMRWISSSLQTSPRPKRHSWRPLASHCLGRAGW